MAAPARADSAKGATEEGQRLGALIRELLTELGAARGLSPGPTPTTRTLARVEVYPWLSRPARMGPTQADGATVSASLRRIGLLPAVSPRGASDPRDERLVALSRGAAGLYDPPSRALFVVRSAEPSNLRWHVAYERAHVLRDRHFDLRRLPPTSVPGGTLSRQWDRDLALRALVEGDAVAASAAVAARWQGPRVALPPAPVGPMASPLLCAELSFPYEQGASFVRALKASGGRRGVDRAYARPPESSEQVLYPGKYFAYEHPVAALPGPVAALRLPELLQDPLGELGLAALLDGMSTVGGAAVALPPGAALAAVQGWGGDRLVAYGMAGQPPAEVLFTV